MLDSPDSLRDWIITNWDEYCAEKIAKGTFPLSAELLTHTQEFDFSIFRAKQPLDLVNEHKQTPYHLTVFGLPLIDRPPPPQPPSSVAPAETEYVQRLFEVIAEETGASVSSPQDFSAVPILRNLFDRSRLTFYCAEGLKELARDQMADTAYFDTLLDEFVDGLYHDYTAIGLTGLKRLISTVQASQKLQLGGHLLAEHVRANDREGMCHQMANEKNIKWVDQ